jgi:phosphatidate cytidylyltransferase
LGVIFGAGLFGLCWMDHTTEPRGLILGPLAVVLTWFATREALDLMRRAGARPGGVAVRIAALLPVVLVVLTPLVPLLEGSVPESPNTPGVPALRPEAIFGPALLVGFLICSVSAIQRFDGTRQCAIDFAASVFVVVYIGGTIAALALLRLWNTSSPRDPGLILLVATIFIVKAGDIGAYTIGRQMGRRKLAPRLSPGKTWEGALGAVAFSCLAGMAVLTMTTSENVLTTDNVLAIAPWLGYSIALSVTGMIGDLAESLLKRSASVKDSSTWMPGFGGILDVIDSLLLAAPVSYVCALGGLIAI